MIRKIGGNSVLRLLTRRANPFASRRQPGRRTVRIRAQSTCRQEYRVTIYFGMPTTSLHQRDYAALAAVRYRIRRFLVFSEDAARAAGIEPQQHQLLLAIRGLPAGLAPDVTSVAERLQIRHNSAVELVRRAAAAGLVKRTPDPADARRVALSLTRRGSQSLERLSRLHRTELADAGDELIRALRTLRRTTRGRARAR